MPSILKVFALFVVLLVAACGPNTQVPTSATAIVGTKAIIKFQRDELVAEVVDVTDKFVTTAFSTWDGDILFERTEYRGLITVSGTEKDGRQWEFDFDENQLEPLFPLQPGKEVAFKGNLRDIQRGTSFDVWSHVEVVGEKVLDLPEGKRKVFLVEFTRQYRWGEKTSNSTEIIYYDPEYSMVLKKVKRERGAQTYWRVISVERPGNASGTPVRQRRSGTVMI